MKVVGCRAALCPLCTQHITLGSAYSDTAADVMQQAESVREVMNYDELKTVLSVSPSLSLSIYLVPAILHLQY